MTEFKLPNLGDGVAAGAARPDDGADAGAAGRLAWNASTLSWRSAALSAGAASAIIGRSIGPSA